MQEIRSSIQKLCDARCSTTALCPPIPGFRPPDFIRRSAASVL